MRDAFGLERFVVAQDEHNTYEQALEELRAGRKASHWMWFVFPQRAGLGHSAMSRRFAISSLEEARAYLDHPILGTRLRTCATIVAQTQGRTAQDIFGAIDALKLRSSVTLFLQVQPDEPALRDVLDRYFEGRGDPRSLLPQ